MNNHNNNKYLLSDEEFKEYSEWAAKLVDNDVDDYNYSNSNFIEPPNPEALYDDGGGDDQQNGLALPLLFPMNNGDNDLLPQHMDVVEYDDDDDNFLVPSNSNFVESHLDLSSGPGPVRRPQPPSGWIDSTNFAEADLTGPEYDWLDDGAYFLDSQGPPPPPLPSPKTWTNEYKQSILDIFQNGPTDEEIMEKINYEQTYGYAAAEQKYGDGSANYHQKSVSARSNKNNRN
jgi:hypothetical protein